MKGRSIPYTAKELTWIERHKTDKRSESHRMFCEKFGRSDVTLINYNSLCKRKGWKTGRTGEFPKGQTPHNKGQRFNPKGSEKGRFKKGNLPHNTNYLGHERASKDGYIEVSVNERDPNTGYERRYVQKHRWLWEQEHGPVPEGMCLKCLDGDKTNVAPSNWRLIPRAFLPRLNGRFGRGYDEAPEQLKPTIMAVVELEHAARSLRRAG